MAALDQIDRWDVPTVAAGVIGPDGLLTARGPTDRTFPLASVSKVLAAIAVHVAVEEGTVGLDDDVASAGGPEGATVRHLLAHASGLPPDGDRTPLGPPERKRIYSNVGFEVLGDHVADRTGMDMDDYVRAALVDPLGLGATTIAGSPAHGYASSVDDLAALLVALHAGRLLAPGSIAAMTTPAFPDLAGVLPGYGAQDPNPWGLGVEVRGTKDPHWTAPTNSPETWGHFGRAGTFLWWDPDVEVGLVVLTDREFGPWAIDAWPQLAAEVLAEHG
ncbi:beta-lactamase family protein [Acidimicrobiia bacterium EGI L10123]|uniref:serine hydrolase domain-containing protein n=1 Tax=Salinilacustrithrix flava TaxID=2957203 RepID=UPI003D7C270B|nr:beta-lactamase family protein [Acidimicrobiia bacterium EGI L10123]